MANLASPEKTEFMSTANYQLQVRLTYETKFCMALSPSSLSTEFAVSTALKKVSRPGVTKPVVEGIMLYGPSSR